ncbi:MAG: K(+)-transporting ATPase subunit F [Acidimicrobiales bacterium]
MSLFDAILLVVAVGVMGYLMCALFIPERF